MQSFAGSYSMITVPKSGWPVLGQFDVNSVPVIVTSCTLGAGNASAFSTSRASRGLSGLGSGPEAGSFLGDFIGQNLYTALQSWRSSRAGPSGHGQNGPTRSSKDEMIGVGCLSVR